MRERLWQYERPTPADVAHLVSFCTAAVGRPHRGESS
jgi:hypothetical protein